MGLSDKANDQNDRHIYGHECSNTHIYISRFGVCWLSSTSTNHIYWLSKLLLTHQTAKTSLSQRSGNQTPFDISSLPPGGKWQGRSFWTKSILSFNSVSFSLAYFRPVHNNINKTGLHTKQHWKCLTALVMLIPGKSYSPVSTANPGSQSASPHRTNQYTWLSTATWVTTGWSCVGACVGPCVGVLDSLWSSTVPLQQKRSSFNTVQSQATGPQ